MVFTCSYASISQVWGHCDPPAFIDTHALKTTVHPCDESAQADLADKGFASVVTVGSEGDVNKSASSEGSSKGRKVKTECNLGKRRLNIDLHA